MVRLRLYRFWERKLLSELLMKTFTVGADNPVTSISPRPAGSHNPVSRLTPAPQPPPPPLLGYQPLPLLPDLANPRPPARGVRQSPRLFATAWKKSWVGPANPEKPLTVHSSSNSVTGNGLAGEG